MEQPASNPTFCTNNCGFYGSSQLEGMCSKCYRDHVSRSYDTGRTNSFTSYYSSSNIPVTSSSQSLLQDDLQAMNDDQDEVLGRMDEDDIHLSNNVVDSPVKNIENDNSEEQSLSTTTKQENDESNPSLLTHVASAPSMATSRSIDIPTKNDPIISFSAMESSSLGANSMSPMTSSSVDKKKRNRCSWDTCNKKLGLTGFDCRCGGQYCSLHRYANEHNCTFDYKEHGQNEIRKNMPVVQAERVRRI